MPLTPTNAAATLAVATVVVLAAAMKRRRPKKASAWLASRIAFHKRWVRNAGFNSYSHEMAIAIELAIECGEAMLNTAGAGANMKDGTNGIDPQTATDLSNERLVMDRLKAEFPDHGLIGEETAAAEGKVPEIEARPTWIVDPIDGTQNFCAGIPLAVVSIGLCVEGKPTLGVIYDPYRGALPRAPNHCTRRAPTHPTYPTYISSVPVRARSLR